MRLPAAAALFFLSATAEARTVRVSLELATSDCVHGSACPVERLLGDGIVLASRDAGRSTLFVELVSDRGPLVMLEMTYGFGAPVVRYREIQDGELLFRGEAAEAEVALPQAGARWPGPGSFSFRVVADGGVRLGRDGVVEPLGADPTYPSNGGGGGAVVVIGDPDPYAYGDTGGGCGGDTVDEGDDTGGGCEGDTIDDDDGSDDWGDGGGSDDWGDGGGETSSGDVSSGGCEGDTSGDASSGGCEGDTAGDHFAAGRSTFRLLWPIGLAGFVNRRLRARAERTRSRP